MFRSHPSCSSARVTNVRTTRLWTARTRADAIRGVDRNSAVSFLPATGRELETISKKFFQLESGFDSEFRFTYIPDSPMLLQLPLRLRSGSACLDASTCPTTPAELVSFPIASDRLFFGLLPPTFVFVTALVLCVRFPSPHRHARTVSVYIPLAYKRYGSNRLLRFLKIALFVSYRFIRRVRLIALCI